MSAATRRRCPSCRAEGIVISVLTNTAGDPVSLVFPVVQKLASALGE